MSKWFPALAFASVLIATPLGAAGAPNTQRESVAWALTYGVLPPCLAGDSAGGRDQPRHESISGYMDALRQDLAQDRDAALAVARRAWIDTFGPNRPFETGDAGPTALTYIEWLQAHLARLGTDLETRRRLVADAYLAALGRAAYDVEYDYWLNRKPVPFFLVVACLEDWARRNQPGLMATTGPTCLRYDSSRLHALRLTPTIADEARTLLAPGASGDELAAARGENVIAPGATGLLSVGHISFVAVGR